VIDVTDDAFRKISMERVISLKFVSATPLVLEIEQTTAAGSGGRARRGVRGIIGSP
jgi:hypothetical protein